MKTTGKFDKNNREIKEGDIIKYTDKNQEWDDEYIPEIYTVKYGVGTYDAGHYTYLGFYCEDQEGDSDGNGYILTEDSEYLECIT